MECYFFEEINNVSIFVFIVTQLCDINYNQCAPQTARDDKSAQCIRNPDSGWDKVKLINIFIVTHFYLY